MQPLTTRYHTDITAEGMANTESVRKDAMLEPGAVIRPQMTEETAVYLVESLYGLKVKSVKELNR